MSKVVWENMFAAGTLAATDTAAGYSVNNIVDYRPYTKWRAASSGTKYITIALSAERQVDCFGISGHNFNTCAASVTFQYYDLGTTTWTDCHTALTFATNKSFIKTFTAQTSSSFRIKIVTASVAAEFGVVLSGSHYAFPYNPEGPYSPYLETVNSITEWSKAGNMLGTIVENYKIKMDPRYSWLTTTQLNSFLTVYNAHIKLMRPFFYAWDYTGNPAEIYYVKLAEGYVLSPARATSTLVESLDLSFEGISES